MRSQPAAGNTSDSNPSVNGGVTATGNTKALLRVSFDLPGSVLPLGKLSCIFNTCEPVLPVVIPFKVTETDDKLANEPVQCVCTGVPLSTLALIVTEVRVCAP